MSRAMLDTPCPAPTRSSPSTYGQIDAFGQSALDDDTAKVEYTTVIQQEFNKARPRRPGKPGRRNLAAPVFEDVMEGEQLALGNSPKGSVARGLLLGKPAQRRVPKANMGSPKDEGTRPLQSIGQGRAKPPVARTAAPRPDARMADQEEVPGQKDDLARETRRRTIFVPSDDTTFMTIHPGANTTNRLDDTFQLPKTQPRPLLDCIMDHPTGETSSKPTRKPRMSMAVAPRRAPLQQMQVKSNNLLSVDMPGQGGGKENIPPGRTSLDGKKGKGLSIKASEPISKPPVQSRLYQSTSASQARQSVVARNAVPMTKRGSSPTAVQANPTKKRATTANKSSRLEEAKANAERYVKKPFPQSTRSPAQLPPWKAGSNFVPFADVAKAKVQQYPVLSEDVAQPDLYEDSWLSHQETALTEVVNHIFAKAEPDVFEGASEKESHRHNLISYYNQPHVATLHKRLQASLLYGALSQPRDAPSTPDLTRDLGLRRRFLHLWLDTYNLHDLSIAAEIVVGRAITTRASSPAQRKPGSPVSLDAKQSRRDLIGFLETFFVTVDDVFEDHQGQTNLDVALQRRNKTILRSLMLIWLLDQTALPNKKPCMFNAKSTHKSSASVLNTFTAMLVPSIGDIGRALRHFDYSLSYVQDPLDEVTYHVGNLAVDLRDGILLNRLVEVLLYSRVSRPEKIQDEQAEETTIIVMPDSTVLESDLFDESGCSRSRILSQHLKMPCAGRAQKIYNVDIALSALSAHCDATGAVTPAVTADAIVDGHREHTINLLWSLVSTIGLDLLVDRQTLVDDIARINPSSNISLNATLEDLLQAWAAAYGLSAGTKVTNLSTAFANGKVYSAIISSFASFLKFSGSRTSPENNTTSNILRSLGCSTPFINQLIPSTPTIPTRQTTLSNLAYLASRLLPLAKHHHAAVKIQRVFRTKQAWKILHQRVVLMRTAAQCAEVVQVQQQIEGAAVVLQRAWRGVVGRRIACLERDVGAFQALARGWRERRLVVGLRKKAAGFSGRVRGGW